MAIITNDNEKVQLDTIDKKLFFYLSENYRRSRKQLASSLRISPQRLHYRIALLEKRLIEPTLALDYPYLQMPSYLLLFPKLSVEEANTLLRSPHTYLLSQLVGAYRYFAVIIAPDILQFCVTHTPHQRPEIYPITAYLPDNYDGFQVSAAAQPAKKHRELTIDAKDYLVLATLVKKPTASQLEISMATGMTRKTVAQRMKNLEQSAIQKYNFSVDIRKMGMLGYLLAITASPSEVQKVIQLARSNSYTGFIHQSHNKIFCHFVTASSKELFLFAQKLEDHTDAQIEVLQMTGDYLINPLPDCVKEELGKRAKILRKKKAPARI